MLECSRETPIESIHATSYLIERALGENLKDIVPAYHSIAVFSSLSMNDFSLALKGQSEQKRNN